LLRDITDSDSTPSRRGRRLLTLSAGAAVLIAAGAIYLLPSLPKPAPPPPPAIPRSQGLLLADFPDANAGWLLTEATGRPSPGKLWRTVNGGKTWKEAPAVNLSDLQGLHFFDSRNGYLLRLTTAADSPPNQLLVTADGGATWTASSFPKPAGLALFGLSMLDTRHGRAVFTQPVFGSDFLSELVAVYSMDDGRTWKETSRVEFQRTRPDWTFDSIRGPLSFADPVHGLIGVETPAVPVGAYITSDGGRTWALHQLPPPSSGLVQLPGSMSAAAFGGVVLIGVAYPQGSQPGAPAGTTYVYRSDDFGETWSAPVEVGADSGAAPARFVGRDVWWIPNGRSVLRTADGGKTWTGSDLKLPGSSTVKALYPVDASRAWAFAGGRAGVATLLYESTDGASTWKLKAPPG
jgi:photosystem II stability/assembly factor-like uncharacterized protein